MPEHARFCDRCGTSVPRQNGSPGQSKLSLAAKWGLALSLVSIGGLLFISLSGRVGHRSPPSEPSGLASAQSLSPQAQASTSERGRETGQGTLPAETNAASGTRPVPLPTEGSAASGNPSNPPAPSGAPAAETERPPQESGPAQGGDTAVGEPRFEEFAFYEDSVLVDGIPRDALINGAGSAQGRWKYCLYFNFDMPGEERISEIGLADIQISAEQAELILHPQLLRVGDETREETDAEVGYLPFSGPWTNESVELSGNGLSIILSHFYSQGAKDYILGVTLQPSSGTGGVIVLLRP